MSATLTPQDQDTVDRYHPHDASAICTGIHVAEFIGFPIVLLGGNESHDIHFSLIFLYVNDFKGLINSI